MARQISEDHGCTDFDPQAWCEKWHDERARYRSWLLVSADEPLTESGGISAYVFPCLDIRDQSGCLLDPCYRNTGYEVPRCLLNEGLTTYTAPRLTTILSIIRNLQGLDFQQGLAFLVQLFIFVLDHERARQGKESMLFRPTNREFDFSTEEGTKRYLNFVNQPIWNLDMLFKFWDLFGGRFASGVYKGPSGNPGVPNYLSIPPSWLTIEKLKEFYGDKVQSQRIPVLIEPVYKPLAESFLNFYQENRRAGVSLNLAFGALNTPLQAEKVVKQNVFYREGDFWTVIYEGETVRLKDARGLHYITHLLRYPGREFQVMQLVSAVEKPQASLIKQTFYKMDEDYLAEHHCRISALGDAGPIIDDHAKRQLRRRRDELEERLEAGNFENPEQAAEMRQEMHMINAQLRSAIGLGGKERKSADPKERARKAVSKAISRSLETIRHHSPALWQHFHNALRIGYTCSYIPDRPTNWIT
jgi:hypothetical protein